VGTGVNPFAVALAVLVAATPTPIATPTATPTAPAQAGCARPAGVYQGATPWSQRLLAPDRVWPLTAGNGLLVAVLGTGVDAANAQFGTGQVLAGTDVATRGVANTDCDGRGTFAAGLIAARADPRTTFVGVAPNTRILPVRYTQSTNGGTDTADPDRLAAAITVAVQNRAKVVCVLVPAAADSPALRAAVTAAGTADALIVSPATASTGGSYPTASPGVLAVGAVDESGAVVTTESGDYLNLAAPGRNLVGTAAGTGHAAGHAWPVDDSAFAAAYVAGVAALVRAYRPGLTAAQVTDRLDSTAAHPSAGHDSRVGWGVVNAYAAVTAEGVDGTTAASAAAPTAVTPARAGTIPPADRAAAGIALTGVLVTVLIGLGAVTATRGRARRWRVGRIRSR
jgi:hypothetical protein